MRRMQAYIPREIHSLKIIPGVYSFNRHQRFRWLQRICIWVLDKLGCQYYDIQSNFETVTIDFDDIVELVLDQRYAIEYITGKRCKYLVLGREQMVKLRVSVSGQMLFQFPYDYRASIRSDSMTFAGLNVVFVPWFDGILCLQELE
jgi:hypothetical protein